MKIIKPKSKPEWIGKKVSCQCGCIAELEEGDSVLRSYCFEGGENWHFVVCPECKEQIIWK